MAGLSGGASSFNEVFNVSVYLQTTTNHHSGC